MWIESMNRSSWASGSGYVPSCSIGFWVAMTKNGGRGRSVCEPAVTWYSCMACKRAAWVLGGVRLISSARTMLAKIGPWTNRNARLPVAWSSSMISVPVMSLGIRSGVNWMRLNFRCRARASVATVKVLARPGTPMVRQWPRAKRQISISSIICSWPMITLWISRRSISPARCTRLDGFLGAGLDGGRLRWRRHAVGSRPWTRSPKTASSPALPGIFSTRQSTIRDLGHFYPSRFPGY